MNDHVDRRVVFFVERYRHEIEEGTVRVEDLDGLSAYTLEAKTFLRKIVEKPYDVGEFGQNLRSARGFRLCEV